MRRLLLCLVFAGCGDDGESADTTTSGTTTSTMMTTMAASSTDPATLTEDPPTTGVETGDTTSTGPDPDTGSGSSTTGSGLVCNEVDAGGPSFVDTVWPLLVDRCGMAGQGCHQDGDQVLGVNLDMKSAYDSIVCVEASEADLFRVNPGDPDGSYFLAKLEGRQMEVGGIGVQMPLGLAPLEKSELSTIRDWISGGAAP